ncbi:nickel ABC transporter permease, partial [Aduncisulcus paluster]
MKNANTLFILILTFTFAFAFSATESKAQATNPFLAPQKQEAGQMENTHQPASSPFGKAAPAPSPFGKASPAPAPQSVQKDWTGGIYSKVMFKITMLQKEIRAQLTGFARDIKKTPSANRSGSTFMSWVITLVHVGSATAAVCLAYLFLDKG